MLAAALAAASQVFAGLALAQSAAPAPEDLRQQLDKGQSDLRVLEETRQAAEDQRRKIEAEVELIRNDRARLNAALIETAARARAGELRMAEIESRLTNSQASEAAIRRSLESRRAVIADVLAALQRMGRRPPPAVLVRPEDMLEAIRTSMLLGAVVPELRGETEALAADLGDLVQARRSIVSEGEALRKEAASLGAERERVAALVEARQKILAEAETALAGERARASDLARQSGDLKELIARMESDVSAAMRGAQAARRSDEEQKLEPRPRLAAGPFRDPARLAPATPFAQTRGLLPLPVSGALVKAFGAPDVFGGAEKGLSLAARPRAVVISPSDGWVAYSGPYRTYGQLLIINAGGGYYVVLAGMDRINVEVGQFVLAGEPIGVMGDGSAKTAAAIAIGASQPILYIEFRKDGTAIDPGPWWARSELEKVRG
jgi:septal ring factor EnvC (AmiA/AmiB activator)